MAQQTNRRLLPMDVVRLFACLCILTIHFNASASGYDLFGQFIFPNAVVPNRYLGIYLGDIGVNLFFIVSGAALAYTWKGSWLDFYRRRARSLYPAFWIAFTVATLVQFALSKHLPAANPLELLVSAAGMDGYAMIMNWGGYSFYQVGEWFLGCILLVYLVFPLVHEGYRRMPWVFSAVLTAAWAAAVQFAGVNNNWFFMKLPLFLAGMLFVTKLGATMRNWRIWAFDGALAVLWAVLRDRLAEPIRAFILCAVLFSALWLIAELAQKLLERIEKPLVHLSALTYPLFLVHHKLISLMAGSFELEEMSRRDLLALYALYLVVSVALAEGLMKLTAVLFPRRKKAPVPTAQ